MEMSIIVNSVLIACKLFITLFYILSIFYKD